MKHFIAALFLIISFSSVAQDSLPAKSATYKEDQWYASLSFLFANESINGFRFNGISQAFSVGFIRDISLNAESNRALGFGLGYGISNYGSNLTLIEETGSPYEFNLIENILLASKNRLILPQPRKLPEGIRKDGESSSKLLFCTCSLSVATGSYRKLSRRKAEGIAQYFVNR